MPNRHFDPFCLSSYLALRYVAEAKRQWCEGVGPTFPQIEEEALTTVSDPTQIIDALRGILSERFPKEGGILLSGGIDSAILAALLPKGVKAYTIRFVADGAIDESEQAAIYADMLGLDHTIVDITWQDYLDNIDALCKAKSSPLHAVEVGLYVAARRAHSDGVRALVVGNGADSTFGGLDKLLSEDWSFDRFVERYSFLEPRDYLEEPVDMVPAFEPYRRGAGIDYVSFLKNVHGIGITQAFLNGIETANCKMIEPYEELALGIPLDLHKVRNGESKYLLRDVFVRLFPGLVPPEKIPFARPMDQWLAWWQGPTRPEFLTGVDYKKLSGDQRWMLYCLERFLNAVES